MPKGGARSNSGPAKGAKYRPRGNKKEPNKPEKGPTIPQDIKDEAKAANMDPLSYMLKVMNDETADPNRRDRMAMAAAPFVHARKGEGMGKKEEQEERSKAAAEGKFSAGRAPLSRVK